MNNWINQILRQEWDTIAIDTLSFILTFAMITAIFIFAKKAIGVIFKNRYNSRISLINKKTSPQRIETINNLMHNAATYALYFIYAYALLKLLGFPVETLIASAGIVGVAFGLGAQNFVKDLLNGIFIITENQFETGDVVTIPQEGITGTILSTGVRTTTVKAANGDIYYIPNSYITIVNNQSRQAMRVLIDLPLDDDMDLNLFKEVIGKITREIKGEFAEYLTQEPSITGMIRGEYQTFMYRITFYVKNGEQYRLNSVFYERYFIALQEHNIQFPISTFTP